jgi:hypothetical protein
MAIGPYNGVRTGPQLAACEAITRNFQDQLADRRI